MNEKCVAALLLSRSGGTDAVDDARGHGVSCVPPELALTGDTFPRHSSVKLEA